MRATVTGFLPLAVPALLFTVPVVLLPQAFAACPLPLLYATILACSDAQNRQLVARLSRSPIAVLSPLTAVGVLVAAYAVAEHHGMLAALAAHGIGFVHVTSAVAAAATLLYVRYAAGVIGEITRYLGIYCFSMKLRPAASGSSAGARPKQQ